MQINDTIKVKNDRPVKWFGKEYPEYLDVQVLKVFKNGLFRARIKHHMCKKVQHFKIDQVV